MKFEELDVWRKSARLSSEIYKALAQNRDYGFRDQITRAGLSIPSNIAEGFERESVKECVNFLSYAKGSCGELRTQIYVGREIGYLAPDQAKDWIQESKEISAMLKSLIKTRRTFNAKKPGDLAGVKP